MAALYRVCGNAHNPTVRCLAIGVHARCILFSGLSGNIKVRLQLCQRLLKTHYVTKAAHQAAFSFSD